MRLLIRSLVDEPGVVPIFFRGDLRDNLMGVQEEADFCYDAICKLLPEDHWIQPGRSARKLNITYLRRRVKHARR